jgi:hypothetical protein
MDGIMEQVVGASRTQADWIWNNPKQPGLEFVAANESLRRPGASQMKARDQSTLPYV